MVYMDGSGGGWHEVGVTTKRVSLSETVFCDSLRQWWNLLSMLKKRGDIGIPRCLCATRTVCADVF